MSRIRLTMAALLLCTSVGSLRAQQPTPDSCARTIAGLRYQWLGTLAAAITNARAHGQSPAKFGAALGHIIVASWGKDQTPQDIGRGMVENFNFFGQRATLVEDTPERAVLRIARTDSAAFARDMAMFGSTREEVEETVRAVIEAAASDRRLVWKERREGDTIVATVTRKQ